MKKQLTFLLLASVLTLGACSNHHPNCSDGQCKTCSSCTRRQEGENFVKTPAYFEFDSAVLSQQDKDHLQRVAKRLHHQPDEKVRLSGYTDNIGTEQYNMNLSRERATSAANYLETLGIASDRIQIRSFGASHFADSNDTAQGRAHNRRVEVSFFK